jgi:hypothetical protein
MRKAPPSRSHLHSPLALSFVGMRRDESPRGQRGNKDGP